ncbi:helix-turn-helix domain-containing protein [Actinomadura fulvescens]|uniref:helix-turn-helix domain-containing protein n=1 Tax=Actinomadura fulvescens TaxID=46160 RepID=UPI0031D42D8F
MPKASQGMDLDLGPVVHSAILRSTLHRYRREADLTQEFVARHLEWSPSKVIRIEGGQSGIRKTDLEALLKLYGVTELREVERLLDLARSARERGWWHRYQGRLEPTFLSYLGYETGASFIREFQAAVIPPLLQIDEYADIIAGNQIDDGTDRALTVEVTRRRRETLAWRQRPPRRLYLLDEMSIRRHVGIRIDPGVMPRQPAHLAETVETDPSVMIRVVPVSSGAYAGMNGAFALLQFQDGLLDEVVYREGIGVLPAADRRVLGYREAFEAILEDALPAEDSLELITAVAEEMR